MENPNYVRVGDKKYKLNTSYKTAIECNEIAQNVEIGDYERALGIIYTLYGDDGLNSHEDWQKLLELGIKYLSLGIDTKTANNETSEPDFDYIQDMDYIKSSFMFDYGIDLDKETDMHWWTFSRLLNGLSNSELGTCCILNRVRNLRNLDLSQIKDAKERSRLAKAKEEVKLKPRNVKEASQEYTQEEKNSINRFYKEMGILRKEE